MNDTDKRSLSDWIWRLLGLAALVVFCFAPFDGCEAQGPALHEFHESDNAPYWIYTYAGHESGYEAIAEMLETNYPDYDLEIQVYNEEEESETWLEIQSFYLCGEYVYLVIRLEDGLGEMVVKQLSYNEMLDEVEGVLGMSLYGL